MSTEVSPLTSPGSMGMRAPMLTCTANEIVVPIDDTNSALLSARDASASANVSPVSSTFMSSVI